MGHHRVARSYLPDPAAKGLFSGQLYRRADTLIADAALGRGQGDEAPVFRPATSTELRSDDSADFRWGKFAIERDAAWRRP